jgi:DNA-binding NarL/FixJ family response regulator
MSVQRFVEPRARVFILSSQSLFDLGVENLLRQEAAVEIVGRESDLDQALVQIRDLTPDVVLVNSADASCYPTAAMYRLMNEITGTRIIKLNLQNNTVCIYREEQREVEEVGDLARFVCEICDQ